MIERECESVVEVDNTELYSSLFETLKYQQEKFDRRWILFPDIDNTAYKEGVLNQSFQERVKEGAWAVGYVTGRPLSKVISYISSGDLPVAQTIASRLGTKLYVLKYESLQKSYSSITEEDYLEDKNFIYSTDKGTFDKKKLYEQSPFFIEKINDQFPKFKLDLQVRDQQEHWLKNNEPIDPYILSYKYVVPKTTSRREIDSFLATIRNHYPGAHAVYSKHMEVIEDSLWNLDIIPFGKDASIRYVSNLAKTGGMIAGDSGNDALSLFASYEYDFLRVVVGGASEELMERVVTEGIDRPERKKSPWIRTRRGDLALHFYLENSILQGPESLAKAMLVAERSWSLFHTQN